MTSEQHRPLLVRPLDEILKVFERNHVEPPWSHVLVLGLDAIALLVVAWCVWELLEARRAARQAKRIEQANLPLHEGARFVAGNVELARGSTHAIRVTIRQEGTQREYKGNITHTWTEIERHVEAVPFYIRTAHGERVRVEPPIDVMLADKLDQMEWLELTRRRRRAELVPEEWAIIEGVLERGQDPELQGASSYRSASSPGWIMKPTERRGMHVSTEGLSRRHELRARAFTKTAIGVIVINLLASSVLVQYHARLLLGRNVAAEYGGKEFYQTKGKNGRVTHHHGVKVTYMDFPRDFFAGHLEVNAKDFSMLPEEGGQIWIRYVPGHSWCTALGRGSSVEGPFPVITAALIGIGVFLVIRTKRHRRWFEGQLIETGQGPFPNPTNTRFLGETIEWPKPTRRPVAPLVDRISVDLTNETERKD